MEDKPLEEDYKYIDSKLKNEFAALKQDIPKWTKLDSTLERDSIQKHFDDLF